MLSVSTLCLLKILSTTKKLLLLTEENLKNLNTATKKMYKKYYDVFTLSLFLIMSLLSNLICSVYLNAAELSDTSRLWNTGYGEHGKLLCTFNN